MKKIFVLFVLSTFFCGCATDVSQKSNLTPGMVNKKVEKGITTQNEIIELFGAPNIISKNKSGNEVWTYDKISTDSKSSESFATIILAGMGSARSSSASKTFTFMIEFDENGTVKEYTYRSAEF